MYAKFSLVHLNNNLFTSYFKLAEVIIGLSDYAISIHDCLQSYAIYT